MRNGNAECAMYNATFFSNNIIYNGGNNNNNDCDDNFVILHCG